MKNRSSQAKTGPIKQCNINQRDEAHFATKPRGDCRQIETEFEPEARNIFLFMDKHSSPNGDIMLDGNLGVILQHMKHLTSGCISR